jgi:hypothetical protein
MKYRSGKQLAEISCGRGLMPPQIMITALIALFFSLRLLRDQSHQSTNRAATYLRTDTASISGALSPLLIYLLQSRALWRVRLLRANLKKPARVAVNRLKIFQSQILL